MKIKLLLLSVIFCFNAIYAKDIVSDIASSIKTGNSAEVSKYFSESVGLKIIDKEETYSKSQAELILKDFFIKHPVKSFTISHQSMMKGDSQYALGILITTNGKYRVYFLIKKIGDKQRIQQFRIETENE